MTRHDYDLIAKVFREVKPLCEPSPLSVGETVRRALAKRLATEIEYQRGNGGFKRDAFLEACKVTP